MLQMKMDSATLISFLNKVSLEKIVADCLIVGKGNRIVSRGVDDARAIYFEIYEEAEIKSDGTLPIGDIPLFIKKLSRFDGNITIINDGKHIKIKRKNKKGKFQFTPKEEISSFKALKVVTIKGNVVTTPALKLEYKNNSFIIESEQLQSVAKDADILGEHLYYFIIEEKKVRISVKKDGNLFVNYLSPEKAQLKKDMKLCFGHGIKEIFNELEGNAKIYLEKKPPMLIKFGKGYRSKYLVMEADE